ncbi:MAG: STT3 domain-containing protein [Desulfurella sp.]|uniref:STT3 domain-containing protein n=1 Tax=Desulfurella sp. TaxID=1962857 RepID=UPI003D13B62C
MSRKKVLISLLIICIAISLGLAYRFYSLYVWNQNPSKYYYKGNALYTEYDAFYYSYYAKAFNEGLYKPLKQDPLRFYPDKIATFPPVIFMISFLSAELSKLLHVSIQNLSVYMVPILAVLFVIPLVFYLMDLGYPLAAFSSSVTGVLSLIYIARTLIARLRPDCMNLFFPLAIGYFLYLSQFRQPKKSYLYAIIAGIFAQLYYWWYMHEGIILAFAIVYILSFGFTQKTDKFFHIFDPNVYKKRWKEIILFLISTNPIILYMGIHNAIFLINVYLIDFFKPTMGVFPNVFVSIAEAARVNLHYLSQLTSGNFIVFLASLVGLALFLIMNFRKFMVFLPLFFIGLMSFKGAERFAMYLAPFLGLGFGYLFDMLVKLNIKKINNVKNVVASIMAIVLTIIPLAPNIVIAEPKITPQLYADFVNLNKITPKSSVIWTWWDYGTAIEFLANRATFHDGQSQIYPKTYFIATSYSDSNPEIAYNTISAISNIGNTGIEKLLKEKNTPQEIRDKIFEGKFNAPLKRPTYFAFTGDEIGKFGWINYFGTWDFKKKKGIFEPIGQLGDCKKKSEDTVFCGLNEINIKKMYLKTPSLKLNINTLAIYKDKKLTIKSLDSGSLYIDVVYLKNSKINVYILQKQPFYSMFNQMYILRNYDPEYFELVFDNFPTMVLYKVNKEPKQLSK